MKKVTCRFCLQPEAILTVKGELADLFLCHFCGQGFDIEHASRPFNTEARPQTFALPAVGDVPGIPAA